MAKHVIILGAGISGLSAAWRLGDNGIKVDLFESNLSVGGLAGTLRENNRCLDIGPHSFFSHDREIVELICGLFKHQLKPLPRKVKLYYKGKYIDYPLTVHSVIFQMGLGSGLRAGLSFLKSRFLPHKRFAADENNTTVEEWAISHFGEYLYKSFFKPYTEQFWKVPCAELSSRSIPTHTRMSFINTLKALLHQKTSGKKESLIEREMCPAYYPDNGFVEIAERIAGLITEKQNHIHLGCTVTNISEHSGGKMRVIYQYDGQQKEIESDYIISTIPVSSLAKILSPVLPQAAMASAGKLEYRPLVVLGMLTPKQKILNCGYLYLLNRPFNRIFEMNEFIGQAEENILGVEIPCLRDGAVWNASKEELFNMCISSLAEDGFIEPGDVKKLFLIRAPHAYPIYRQGYATHLNCLLTHLKQYKSLTTLGRCGEFRYMDIDECIKRAFEFVDSCLLKKAGRSFSEMPGAGL